MSANERIPPGPTATIRFADSQASVLLDLTRGLAALLVLFDHWRTLLFVDYGEVAAHRVLLAPIYILSSCGRQAVIIFFVLSGYLISGSVFRTLANDRWSWKAYLAHRLTRLWIVLLPGLLLGLMWDTFGLKMNLAPVVYSGLGHGQQVLDVRTGLTPLIFAGNALFLQTIKVRVLGSNGALWSLANEFWYYIFFPLVLLALLRKTPFYLRCLYVGAFVALASFVGGDILVGFWSWLLGTLLAKVRPPNCGRRIVWLAAAVYMSLVIALPKIKQTPSVSSAGADFVMAVFTFGFLWILLSQRQAAKPRTLAVRLMRGLAQFSFTLYVTHEPLMLFLTSLWQGDGRYQPTLFRLAMGAGILLVTMLYAWLIAIGTEFHTDRVRGFVERRLSLGGLAGRSAGSS